MPVFHICIKRCHARVCLFHMYLISELKMASTSELGSGAFQEQAKVSCRKRKRIRGSIFCPHCSDTMSKTTCYRHRKTFYDKSINKWNTNEGCIELPVCGLWLSHQ